MTTYESATQDLIVAIDQVAEPWLENLVLRVVATRGVPIDDALRLEASIAAREGRQWVGERLRVALEIDVDAQRLNPLQILSVCLQANDLIINLSWCGGCTYYV